MIPMVAFWDGIIDGKPRASGDDPRVKLSACRIHQ